MAKKINFSDPAVRASFLGQPVDAAAIVAAINTILVSGRKYLICDVIQTLRSNTRFSTVPRQDLEVALIAAHKSGALILSRADIVMGVNPDSLRQSEVRHLEASYHYVEKV